MQVAVPSRTTVSDYDQYRRQIEELVGSINGRYSTLHNDSVRYLFQSVSQNDLVVLMMEAATVVPTGD